MKKQYPKVAVLGSTRGTAFRPILKHYLSGQAHYELSCVISDRAESGILKKMEGTGIEALFIDPAQIPRAEFNAKISAKLRALGVEIVLLIGFMRILTPEFVNEWHGRLLNVHPSLLPVYAGMMNMQVHEAVLANGETVSGCTVHLVSEEVDAGEIILQKRCLVIEDDTPETLQQKVQNLESEALMEIISNPAKYLPVFRQHKQLEQ